METVYFHFGDILDDSLCSEKFVLDVWKHGKEFEVNVDCLHYSPYRPATMYQRNGDPGDPAEDAEVELSETAQSLTEKAMRELHSNLPYFRAFPAMNTGWGDLLHAETEIRLYCEKEIEKVKQAYLEQFADEPDEPDRDYLDDILDGC